MGTPLPNAATEALLDKNTCWRKSVPLYTRGRHPLRSKHQTGWLKRAVRVELDPHETSGGLSMTNKILCGFILAAVGSAIVETEPTISDHRESYFRFLELLFGLIFAIELLVRGWSVASEATTTMAAWHLRVRWLISFPTFIDVLALVPTVCSVSVMPLYGLRLLRLRRILRIARLGRFTRAWAFLARAIISRRDELLIAFAASMLVMLLSSTALYLIEGAIQPQKFGSIPRAMWWALVTLTTIGYGDVTPVTPLGKVFAGVTAFLGIGLIAAPTGILAAAFTQAAHQGRGIDQALSQNTPVDHTGKSS